MILLLLLCLWHTESWSTESSTEYGPEEYLAELDSFDKFWKSVYGLMVPHYHKHDIWDYKKKDALPLEWWYIPREDKIAPTPTITLGTNQPLVEESAISRRAITCGGGIPGSSTIPQDVCAQNRSCTILELACSGSTYYSPSVPPQLSSCKVKQIRCYDDANNWSPDSDPQHKSDDFYDILLDGDCIVQKFACEGRETRVHEIGEDLYSCKVQVVCDNQILFGYQGFGMKCLDSQLFCSGSSVNTQFESAIPDSGDCSIESVPCDVPEFNDPTSCTNIKKHCPDDSSGFLDAICTDKIVHEISNCQVPENRCQPYSIECAGEEWIASNYTGVLSLCTNTKSVMCGTTLYPFQNSDTATDNQICRIQSLMCPSGPVLFTLQSSIPDGCYVSKVICISLEEGVPASGCTVHSFTCVDCYYQINHLPCKNYCIQEKEAPSCICPVDKEGPDCQTQRRIDCKLTPIISDRTENHCLDHLSSQRMLLEGFLCLTATLNETIQVAYNLSCSIFGIDYNKTSVMNDGIPYLWIGQNLAISDRNSRWALRGSFIDFDHLSQGFTVDSPVKELEGNVSFQIKLSEIPTNLWTGNDILLMEQYLVTNVAGKMSSAPVRVVIRMDSGTNGGSIETARRWYQQNKDTIIPALIIGCFVALVVGTLAGQFLSCECGKKKHLRIGN